MPSRRPVLLGLTLALVATACSAADSSSSTPSGTDRPTPDATASEATAPEPPCTPVTDLPGGDVEGPPATSDPFPWDRPDPRVLDGFDADEIISGGPPPDGIRPIDAPCFDDVATADTWLADESPVMVVEVDDDRRAYPLAIMTQHEIANDVIGGVPVVVTYCPLCNSGLAFERTVDGDVLDFGTSGRLFRSNLVMYDRQTRTLWSQFAGEAVVGDLVPTRLERLSTALLGWAEFRDATPDGLVLSRQVFPERSYGRNPYPGYEGSGDGFLFRGPRDDRLDPNVRVVGIGDAEASVAVPLADLREDRVVEVEVGDRPLTVWWAPGQASALDASQVDGGEDVGSTGVFDPVLDDGLRLRFAPDPDDPGRFVDDATGSRWNLLGEAVEGELAGATLAAVPRDDTFWFVWFAFRPETRVVR